MEPKDTLPPLPTRAPGSKGSTLLSIRRLLEAPAYKSLTLLEETFNLFNVISECIDENAYSRFLAFLLDSSRSHRLGVSPCRAFLSHALSSTRETQTFLAKVAASKAKVEWGTEEQRRIDIVVQLFDNQNALFAVFGIENKTWSDEQERQLGDYQVALTQAYPGVRRMLFFLTPDGRKETTGNDADETCPVVAISYKAVVSMCESVRQDAPQERAEMLHGFQEHLRFRFSGTSHMNETAKQLILKLYGDAKHRKALRLISQYLPNVAEFIKGEVTPAAAKSIGLQVDFAWFHPQKPGTAFEFNFNVGELNQPNYDDTNFYVLYMLLFEERRRPADIGVEATVQVMLRTEKGSQRKAAFLKENLLLPPSPRRGDQWGPWRCLWVGQSYTLRDLGEKDASGLSAILKGAVKHTYKPLLEVMSRIRKGI